MKRIVVFVLLIALACSCVCAEAISEQVTKSYDDQYIDLQGDWNFKVYRKYDQMYQYLPYGMCNVLWEDLEEGENVVNPCPSDNDFAFSSLYVQHIRSKNKYVLTSYASILILFHHKILHYLQTHLSRSIISTNLIQ